MAFITVEDLYGSVEVVVFPNSYEKKKELPGPGPAWRRHS